MDQSKLNNGFDDEQFKQPKKDYIDENLICVSALHDSGPYNGLAPYKIYLLKRIFSVGYDEYDGKVVIASNAKAARKMANLKFGEEGPIWADANLVLCKEIIFDGPMVVLESFRAG